jgi:predicted transcriptional regulator
MSSNNTNSTPLQAASLTNIASWLEAEPLAGNQWMDRTIEVVFSCDLMSDVLAFSNPQSLLLTGLTNQQVIRTAEVAGMLGIVFVRGKRPSQPVLDLAEEFSLPVLLTRLSMFEASGRLYSRGLKGFCSTSGGEKA